MSMFIFQICNHRAQNKKSNFHPTVRLTIFASKYIIVTPPRNQLIPLEEQVFPRIFLSAKGTLVPLKVPVDI
jgi:hypothetical protein